MSAKNKVLIQQINDAIVNGDMDFFSSCLSENARWTIVSVSSISGRDNILAAMQSKGLESVPAVHVNNIIAEEETVTVQSSGIARRQSGGAYHASYCDVYRLADGKIQEFTTYVNDSG